MKKIVPTLTLLALIVFSGCGSKGEKLFSKELCDGITEVRYMDFQGNETVYTDEDSIHLMADALQAGTYEKIKDENMVVGLYGFTFVSNGKEYGIGYSGSNIIQYDWHQYTVHNNKFKKLLSLTE
ncbi:MAG: hypothetical protein HFH14_03525 [Lachnospiraceae bacterium]|nr:hypothetical protein [Lachnospiraceae bacterium]